MTGKVDKFEDALSKLESIVEQLETGDIPLDKSLDIFEEGVKLYKNCQKQLDKANHKIEVLSKMIKSEA